MTVTYASKAAYETAMRELMVNVVATMLWGDPHAGLTPADMQKLTHDRASLGVYDGMASFSVGMKFFRLPKAKNPTQIYSWNGSHLFPIDAATWVKLNVFDPPILGVTDAPDNSTLYQAQVAPGVVDPRV